MHLDIFGTCGCSRCDEVKNKLNEVGINYDYYDLENVVNAENMHPKRYDALAIYHFYSEELPFAINCKETYSYQELLNLYSKIAGKFASNVACSSGACKLNVA
ncbi:MAG: hypothetical protein GF387_00105 [Candidatus Portnoybacteria bacterium]|nr:hypothetical protein [Candidatus Portnoybacteria bacterium]